MWTVSLVIVLNVLAFSSAKIIIKRDPSSPLFLTPYIENGKIREAKRLALVTDLIPRIRSYSGFITIDKEHGDNLFFWFFPSKNDWLNDPLTVWLEGGPGIPSLDDVFGGLGPYTITEKGKLKRNQYSWNRNSSLLFVDNPVGAGYSFTKKDHYSVDDAQVADGMLKMLDQFFRLFPELKKNPFFLAGVSYAGKYVTALAHAIHKTKPNSINLQGIAIGNGRVDPVNQIAYDDYLYQLGLIDENRRDQLHKLYQRIAELVEAEEFLLASAITNDMWGFMDKMTGDISVYNYLLQSKGSSHLDLKLKTDFYGRKDIREAIHAGNSTLNDIYLTYYHLRSDIMRSVRPLLEELLENDYRVLVYNGQLDIIVAYPLTINFVKKLNWKGAEEYKTAKRNIWMVGKEVAGYAKTVRSFTELLMRDAGHFATNDKPKWSLDMYNRFLFNQSFGSIVEN